MSLLLPLLLMLDTLSLRLPPVGVVELDASVDFRCFFSLFTETGVFLKVFGDGGSGISGGVGDVEVETETDTAASFFFFGSVLLVLLIEVLALPLPPPLVSVEVEVE